MKKSRSLKIVLMASLFLVFMTTTSFAVSVVDDFSADTGNWSYVGSAQRDLTDLNVLLTPATVNQVGQIWLNQAQTGPFTARFKYKAGVGSGADGLVFMFNKKPGYNPSSGGSFGFTDTNDYPVPGYGIEFDSFSNWENSDPLGDHIALIKDHENNHLRSVVDSRVEDNQWHDVKVQVGDSSVIVYVDGDKVIDWSGTIDRTYGGIGFSAATGLYTNEQRIDDVSIISDTTAPHVEITNLASLNNQILWANVNIQTRVDDSRNGNSIIGGAEYFIDTAGANGTGTAMDFDDGNADSSIENMITAWDSTKVSNGAHKIYVHARDSQGNWSNFISVNVFINNIKPVDIGDSKIAFGSDRSGNLQIYVMDADGTNQTRLTNNSSRDYFPEFSPDGSKITFTAERDGNAEIYVMNADGTNQTRLTNNAAGDYFSSFSSDGSKVVFTSNRDGNNEIYIMNTDGTNQVNLTNNPSNYDDEPDMSPDGSKITYRSWIGGTWEIYVMNADGTNQTRLTYSSLASYGSEFSPDGSRIVYRHDNSSWGGSSSIWIMNADGSGQTTLTDVNGRDGNPAYSPDGSKIAFERQINGKNEIYVMNADGSSQVNLSNNSAGDNWPAWGPAQLIKNNSFELDDDSDGIPDSWKPLNFAQGDGRSGDFNIVGRYTLKIAGDPLKLKYVKQKVDVSGNIGDSYTLSGWNKNIDTTYNGKCIRAYIYLKDATGKTIQSASIPFSRSPHDWKKGSVSITARVDYSYIEVLVANANQTGVAYFDDFMLLKK